MTLHTKLKSLLLNAGLSETESMIYVELLRKPAQTIWELKERTRLSKSAVYRAFDHLQSLKLVEKTEDGIQALSLKSLVADLSNKTRKINKTLWELKDIAPYLKRANEPIEKIEFYYTQDQFRDVYMFMAEQDYDVNLDFGDFENFVPILGGGLEMPLKFREKRVKHAGHHAICTTHGKYFDYFNSRDAQERFKNNLEHLKFDFRGSWMILSDKSDYVMFNHFEDPENPHCALVKSKAIADAQRKQFDYYSQQIGN